MKLNFRYFWKRFNRHYFMFLPDNFYRTILINLFIINNRSVQEYSLKFTASSLYVHIFCIFSKVWTVWGQICWTAYGRTLFSTFGLNVWRNQTEISFHSNRSGKISLYLIESTISFIANIYITPKKQMISYQFWAQSLQSWSKSAI